MVRIAILGAGIVGLTTAVNVQREIPLASVTIIADKFGTDTTSSGSGGFFRPTTTLVRGVQPETVKEWAKDSWDYFFGLAMSSQSKETGHSLVSGYIFSDEITDVEAPLFKDIVLNFRVLSSEEQKRINPNFKYGCFFTTIVTQNKKFMPWLMTWFKKNGGQIDMWKVNKLDELAGRYDIVINCTGLGSRQLLKDQAMYPAKGQLVLVKAPWIRMFVLGLGHNSYFIPHDDYIIVGGTREKGVDDQDVVQEVQDDILKRAAKLLPQIKGAKVVGSWSGVRPHRDPVRLEKEIRVINGKKLGVVHNYGHGANGVSLSWGTAIRAAKMAKEIAEQVAQSAKL
ncbi:hypothetical protein C0Q70_19366 [Pomacea canaliculata]|uniref:FAD dependent oxidoreductase domain-containing protein n=3 Tax=Pomacea canaliculata TaxID=400727 RepID=A0A2T7NJ61_POMCA|nr:hypothetical protein C0Q70_19366 [Pomacea canaliculata]